MLDKKYLWLAAVTLCGVFLMAGYNRPYRLWPINGMSEQRIIKPFTKDSLRTPPEGSVAVDAWEPVPAKMDLLINPALAATIPNPVEATPASIAKGKELYSIYCFPCHGIEMSPDPAKFSPVKRGNRPGSDSTWAMPAADINLLRAANYSDEHIFTVISNGSAIMKRLDYHLSPEERWNVVNYVRSLVNAKE